jgi:hypothetical protein
MSNSVTGFAIRPVRCALRRPTAPAAAGALLVAATMWAAVPARAAAAIAVNCATTDLQTAINTAPSGSTLSVNGSCTGTFTISTSLRLVGRGTAVLDANRTGPPLVIGTGVTVGLANLVIENGGRRFGSPRAGLRNEGADVTLRNVTVRNNFGGLEGIGAISNSGTMVIYDSTVTGNQAESGAGIGNGGRLTLKHTSVTGNSGGAIANGGTLTLVDSTVSGNRSHITAGGIYNGGTVTLNNSVVADNFDDAMGTGGISNRGTLRLNESRVTGNTGDQGVGGITNKGTAILNDSAVTGNASTRPSLTRGAGGIYNTGTVRLHNTPVTNNIPNNCLPPGSVTGCTG